MLITLLIAVSFTVELVTCMTFQKYFCRVSGPEDKVILHLKQNFVSYFYHCVQNYPNTTLKAKAGNVAAEMQFLKSRHLILI